MLETQEQIEDVLSLAGENIILADTSIIKAMPAFELYILADGNSPHNITQQTFIFHVSVKDYLEKILEVNSNFTFETFGQKYFFKIRNYTDTLIGWMLLHCELEGTQSV